MGEKEFDKMMREFLVVDWEDYIKELKTKMSYEDLVSYILRICSVIQNNPVHNYNQPKEYQRFLTDMMEKGIYDPDHMK